MRREPPNRCSLLVRGLTSAIREVRGIGFVEFHHPEDAEDAKYGMDRMFLRGREISVVFAKMGRKRPDEFRGGGGRGGGGGYRRGGGGGGGGGYGRYRSPPRRNYSPRRRRRGSRSVSRSVSRSYSKSYTRSRSRSRSASYSSRSRSVSSRG